MSRADRSTRSARSAEAGRPSAGWECDALSPDVLSCVGMEGKQRRLLLGLTALAVLVMAVQGLTGASELALYAMPFLLMVGLLVSGRFIGEQRILERWGRAGPARAARPLRVRWRGLPERPPASLLERSAAFERAPPALAAQPA